MALISHHDLSLVIRSIHVASMAALLGGALLVWSLSVRPESAELHEQVRALLFAAQRYEWVFWAAIGLLVMTGGGNLGAFGSNLPSRETAWGEKLTVKLLAVSGFVLLSLLRTFLVTRLAAIGPSILPPSVRQFLRNVYAGTALYAAAIAGLAVFLAHG